MSEIFPSTDFMDERTFFKSLLSLDRLSFDFFVADLDFGLIFDLLLCELANGGMGLVSKS